MARKDGPTVAKAIASWAILESVLATPDGPRLWDEHWALVRALRRSYVWMTVVFGLIFGTLAGMGAFLTARSWDTNWLFVLILFLAGPFVLGSGVRQATNGTVAPLVAKPRHVWSRWISVALYELILVSGFLIDYGPWWALATGLLAGLPLWMAAFWETRETTPAFPDRWRPFTTG